MKNFFHVTNLSKISSFDLIKIYTALLLEQFMKFNVNHLLTALQISNSQSCRNGSRKFGISVWGPGSHFSSSNGAACTCTCGSGQVKEAGRWNARRSHLPGA